MLIGVTNDKGELTLAPVSDVGEKPVFLTATVEVDGVVSNQAVFVIKSCGSALNTPTREQQYADILASLQLLLHQLQEISR